MNSANRNLVANKFTFDQTNNNSKINSPDNQSELFKVDNFNLPNEFKNMFEKIKNDTIEVIKKNVKNNSYMSNLVTLIWNQLSTFNKLTKQTFLNMMNYLIET